VQTAGEPLKHAPGMRRVIARRTTVVSAGSGRNVALLDGTAVPISSQESQVLQICGEMHSLDDHVIQIMKRLQIDQRAAVGLIDRLLLAQLIVNESWFLERLRHADEVERSKRIQALVIVTRDRTEQLLECVQSLIRHSELFEHRLDLLVIDDSSSDAVADQNRLALSSLRTPLAVRYAGRQQRIRLYDHLVRRGLSEKVLRYALLPSIPGQSFGAVRNCSLLLTLGMKFISCDDDIVSRIGVHPTSDSTLALIGHKDPLHHWFFASRSDAYDWIRWEEIDWIGQHSSLLGLTLPVCAQSAPDLITEGLCSHLMERPESYRVIGTWAGKIGDCARATSWWTLMLDDDIGERLRTDDEYLSLALASREIAEVCQRPTIVHNIGCMTMCLGLNNEELLPPFLPHYSGEDGLFATMIARTNDTACWGILPHAIVHNARTGRPYNITLHTVSTLLNALVASSPMVPGHLDVAERLQNVGRWLRQVSLLSLTDFQAQVNSARAVVFAPLLRKVESKLHMEGTSHIYNEAARTFYEEYVATISGDAALPIEFRGFGGQGWKSFQQEVNKFAELLIHWQAIVKLAKEIVLKDDSRLSLVLTGDRRGAANV
jgi:hypothetical protein